MQVRIKRSVALLLMLALCLSPGSLTALAAAEQTEVRIPVSAVGADCTAEICGENGSRLQALSLTSGKEQTFTLVCTGVESFFYTVQLTDQDTDTISYDKTVYTVDVELFYREDGTIGYSVSAAPSGASGEGGKPEKIEFHNVYTPLPGGGDPPVSVQKKIEGKPEKPAVFTFVMKPADASYPLPDGAVNGEKEIAITGEGTKEIGDILFSEAGTYEYTITEKNTGEDGYTYDPTVYTVRYEVKEEDGRLVSSRTMRKGDQETDHTAPLVFANTYQTGGAQKHSGAAPKTGDHSPVGVWWSLALASLCGLIAAGALLARKKHRKVR